MHVVAVTRWGAPLERALPDLAARLGVVAYDLRLRMAGGLPAVFAKAESEAEAAEHVAFLRSRGHGAVACDVEAIPGPEEQLDPLDFEIAEGVLRGTCAGGRRFEVPASDVLALVHAVAVSSAEQTVTTRGKKLDLGRAVLTGGLVLTKKVDRVEKRVTDERERALYLFCRSGAAPYVFREHGLRYDGLGDERQLTTAQNFATLSAKLEALSPGAFVDERLLQQKRRADIAVSSGGTSARRVETSNARETDLAVFLLVRGHLESQL